VCSCTNPKKIIEALTPKRAMRAATSLMPVSIAIRTIMIEALTEYSIQRAASLRTYTGVGWFLGDYLESLEDG
jgi:hypothetical protein